MTSPDRGLTGLLGFEFSALGPDEVVLEWEVTTAHHQPYGIVHGGTYCAAIETAASMGAAMWLGDKGKVVGVNNNTDFLRAVSAGRLRATPRPLHRGRSQQLWQVEITDEEQRLVSRGQVRLQNLSDPA